MLRRLPAFLLLATFTLTVWAALGCTEKLKLPTEAVPPPGPVGPLVTPDSIQAIFDNRCIGCHSGSPPAGDMDLSAAHSYASTVNVPSGRCSPLDRIEPNDPNNSCLIRRVEGTVIPRMPLGSPTPLPPADIAKLRNWIAQGAPGVVIGPAP